MFCEVLSNSSVVAGRAIAKLPLVPLTLSSGLTCGFTSTGKGETTAAANGPVGMSTPTSCDIDVDTAPWKLVGACALFIGGCDCCCKT